MRTLSEKLCFIIPGYQGKEHMKRCFYWKNGLCNESEKGSHSAKKLSSLYPSSFQQEDQHDLVRSDSVLQRKHPTFMPRLSIFATASDVSHCEDAAHVSHKNEPGHAEEQ